jgi:four helix bundle protein
MLQSYRDLLVWKKAIQLTIDCYSFSDSFPRSEIYGLTSQLRKASVSVPSNIAEGYGRGSRKEYLRFLWISQGSLKELETQILIAKNLGFVKPEAADELLIETETTGKMLGSLIRSLSNSDRSPY